MNNETVAPNRNCDLKSNSLSTVGSNKSLTASSTPTLTLHFTRPTSQSNVRLARLFTSINNTTRNSATNFSFNETNLTRISHSFELLDRKIENLVNRRENQQFKQHQL